MRPAYMKSLWETDRWRGGAWRVRRAAAKIKLICGPWSNKKKLGRAYCLVAYDGAEETVTYAQYLVEKRLRRRLTQDEFVTHVDGNITNHLPSNLKVVTRTKACDTVYKPRAVRSFTDEQVLAFRKAKDLDIKKVCREHGIVSRTIRKILSGASYQHLDGSTTKPTGRPRKLTDKQVLDIYKSKDSVAKLKKRYKVSQSTIYGIRSGRTHQRITQDKS